MNLQKSVLHRTTKKALKRAADGGSICQMIIVRVVFVIPNLSEEEINRL